MADFFCFLLMRVEREDILGERCVFRRCEMRKRVIVKLLLLAKSGTISVVGWKEEGREGRGILGVLSKSRHDASLAPTKSLGSFDGYPPGCQLLLQAIATGDYGKFQVTKTLLLA
jgi:hypothetical protein